MNIHHKINFVLGTCTLLIMIDLKGESRSHNFFSSLGSGIRSGARIIYHAPGSLYQQYWGTCPEISSNEILDPSTYGMNYEDFFYKVYYHAYDVNAIKKNAVKRSQTLGILAGITGSSIAYKL